MSSLFLLIPVLLPILGGFSLAFLKIPREDDRRRNIYMETIVIATSILVWIALFLVKREPVRVYSFTGSFSIAFGLDGLGSLFAGMVSLMWPLVMLYTFEYMRREKQKNKFFAFYVMTYGVALGIAFSSNMTTMYAFYEMLTLVTIPLVSHYKNHDSMFAGRKYAAYTIGGAGLGFFAVLYSTVYGHAGNFMFGGSLDSGLESTMLQVVFVVGFFGFGAKAAVFPLYEWLPCASVAPTPVTALLHAVAVVKAGVFAVMRLTYFSFGTALLKGTWVQNVVMLFAVFTMLFGASMAVRELHWKRRLVYSTVANLSYILFGVTMMTEAGFTAALMHMAAHACVKILAFFCAGAVLCRTGREQVTQLDGLGRRMPRTFAAFTVAALALTGIPPLNGFVSKWQLLTAAADSENPLAYVGAGVLLLAALLTVIYMLGTVRRVWFPPKDAELSELASIRDADWRMCVPYAILSAGVILTGLFAQPILNAALQIAQGR